MSIMKEFHMTSKLSLKIILFLILGISLICPVVKSNPSSDYQEFQGDFANTSQVKSSTTGYFSLKWKSENSSINIEKYNAPKSSPVIWNGTIFIGDDSGEVFAINFSNGKTLWSKKIASYTGEGPSDLHGIHSTPCVVKGVVYIGTYGGYLYALNASTGDIFWRFGRIGSAIGSSPHYLNDPKLGERLYFSGDDDWVYCIDLNGNLIWKTHNARSDMHSSVGLDPLRGILVVGSNDHNVYGLNLTNGTVIWSFQTGGHVKASPTIDNVTGYVYIGSWDFNMYCLNIETGELIWSFPTLGTIYSSVALDHKNGKIFFASYDWKLYCLNSLTGEKIWVYNLLSRSFCSPVIDPDQNLVFIGTNSGSIFSIDTKIGYRFWKYPTGGAITASPLVVGNKLIISSNDGYLYCFQAENPQIILLSLGLVTIGSITGLIIIAYFILTKIIKRRKN